MTKEKTTKEDSGKLKVLFLPADDGGCGWYRSRQVHEEIKRQGLAESVLIDDKRPKKFTDGYITELISGADIIIGRHTSATMIKQIKTNYVGKKVIYDEDDDVSVISPYNYHYESNGTKDIVSKSPEGKVVPMWVTGQTPGFNKYNNIFGLAYNHAAMECSDALTVTTEVLKDRFLNFKCETDPETGKPRVVPINRFVEVFPNYIDFNLYPDIKVNTPGSEKRVGWMGGSSHMQDVGLIANGVKDILDTHDDTVYYSIGSHYPEMFEGYDSRIKTYSWLPFKGHPHRMKALGLDVAIIPLDDTAFNKCRSVVKFSEFAALKVPILVSDVEPYSSVAEDGVNCLTFASSEELVKKYERLDKDKDLKKKLIKNAYEWVREERDLKKGARKIVNFYKSVASGDYHRKAAGDGYYEVK
jgi:glycosyltransferase involved in cell wall biosynthesis